MKFSSIALIAATLASSSVLAGDPKVAPDVVGRDLNVTGFGALGHVGIWNGSSVIEVLNVTNKVVQSNTLSSFKNASKYWGAKYGIAPTKGLAITSAAWAQRQYSPTYTLTAMWQEGGSFQSGCAKYGTGGKCLAPIYSLIKGKFRCDTFVNYSFWKGSGNYVVGAGNAILPSILYGKFPSTR